MAETISNKRNQHKVANKAPITATTVVNILMQIEIKPFLSIVMRYVYLLIVFYDCDNKINNRRII